MPRVSVEAGYFRRWFNNFTVTDNRALAADAFTEFSVTAPSDPRLPDGGGYVVSGLYNVTQAGFLTPPDNIITDAKNYGKQYQHYNGVLVNVSARPRNGLIFQGGFNTGKTVQDNCAIRDLLPELTTLAVGSNVWPLVNPTNPFCHADPGLVTRFTGFGGTSFPRWTFKSLERSGATRAVCSVRTGMPRTLCSTQFWDAISPAACPT